MKRREACALLATSLGSGCVGGAFSASPTTVRLLWGADADGREETIATLLERAGLPDGVAVEVLSGPSLKSASATVTDALDAGSEEPELFLLDESLQTLADRHDFGVVADELAALDAWRAGRCFSMGRRAATHRDRTVALPLLVQPSVICYRRDLVERQGYDTTGWATNPPSWRTFAAAVRDARAASDAAHGYVFPASERTATLPSFVFRDLLSSWGGRYFGDSPASLFGPVGDRPVSVADPPAVAALRALRSFVHGSEDASAISPRRVLDWSGRDAFDAFVAGDAVAHHGSTRRLALAERALSESQFGTMPVPAGGLADGSSRPSAGPASTYTGRYVVANPNIADEARTATVAVLEAMATDRFLRELFAHSPAFHGRSPTLWLPARPSVYDSSAVRESDIGRHADAVRRAGRAGVAVPVTRVWEREARAINETVSAVLGDDARAEPALAGLAARLARIEARGRTSSDGEDAAAHAISRPYASLRW